MTQMNHEELSSFINSIARELQGVELMTNGQLVSEASRLADKYQSMFILQLHNLLTLAILSELQSIRIARTPGN